jgi:tetratricopeptide (TPR) repeat protein
MRPRIRGIFRVFFLLICVAVFGGCLTGKIRRELAAEYFNLGNAFFELKQYDRAMSLYQRALGYSDTLPESSYNLARVYISQSDYEKAIEMLVGLLASDPENLVLLQTLAYAQAKAGETGDAIVTYRRIISLSPGNVITLYNLSVLYQEDGDSTQAYHYLQLARDLDPADADVLKRLGPLEAEYGSPGTAITYLQTYMEQKPDDTESGLFLSGLYKKEGLYAEALTLVESMASRVSGNPDVLLEHAYLLLTKAGEIQKGMETLTLGLDAALKQIAALLPSAPSDGKTETAEEGEQTAAGTETTETAPTEEDLALREKAEEEAEALNEKLRAKAREFLLDASPAAVKDIKNLFTEKQIFTPAEADEILSEALAGSS